MWISVKTVINPLTASPRTSYVVFLAAYS